jgi:localization factor PodJL
MMVRGVERALAGGAMLAVVAAASALAFVTIEPPPLWAKARPHASDPSPAMAPAEPLVAQQAAPPVSDVERAVGARPAESGPASSDLLALPMAELRTRANANDVQAMEELGRRLIQGVEATKDPQAGAGWMLRAAQLGSAQSAFNMGVMYERGFVVERNSSKAVDWYRKAANAGLAVAKHNLALLLRDGKGAPRDDIAALDLLKSAAHQGMAASMFVLGDVYDRGDAAARDAVEALAWFSIAAEFERQMNDGKDSTLSRTADQRARALQRTLTPEEVARARERAQGEFTLILAELTPARPQQSPSSAEMGKDRAPVASLPSGAPRGDRQEVAPAIAAQPGSPWPSSPTDQVRLVQQALFDLKFLRDKPDGNLGPMTRSAIRDFQKSVGYQPTGEPGKDLYQALLQAISIRDTLGRSPLPMPPSSPASVEESPPKATTIPPQGGPAADQKTGPRVGPGR